MAVYTAQMVGLRKQVWLIALLLALLCHALILLLQFNKEVINPDKTISIKLTPLQPVVEQQQIPDQKNNEPDEVKQVAADKPYVSPEKTINTEQVLSKTEVPNTGQTQTVIISAKTISNFADQESKRDTLSHQQQQKAFSDSFKESLVVNNNQPITELNDSYGDTHVRAKLAGKPVCYRTNNAMVKDEWDVDAVLFYECPEKKQEFKLRR